jgi:hypothetical protein
MYTRAKSCRKLPYRSHPFIFTITIIIIIIVVVIVNIQKTRIISFMRKTNSVHFNYYVSNEIILHSDCIKDLGVTLDSKLYFYRHVDFVYSQALRTLGLICYVTYNFSSLDCII